jgi:hypothetical protein
MNERQRADELARAIDELIHGPTPPGSAQADDPELQSLIKVAQARLITSRHSQNPAVQDSVWQRILGRLDKRPQARREVTQEIVADDAMRDTILARRQMSEAILELAEQHRDEVWTRLQERIDRGPRRAPRSRGDSAGKQADPVVRNRFFPTDDNDLDGLLSDPPDGPSLRSLTRREAEGGQRRLRDRTRNDPAKRPPRS